MCKYYTNMSINVWLLLQDRSKTALSTKNSVHSKDVYNIMEPEYDKQCHNQNSPTGLRLCNIPYETRGNIAHGV
jgi:hypothetical protein